MSDPFFISQSGASFSKYSDSWTSPLTGMDEDDDL